MNSIKSYYVYILASKPRGTLYIGVTNNLQRRVLEYKQGVAEGFTKKYNIKMLVYLQQYSYIEDALVCEKRLKKWERQWKIDLIEEQNPLWIDLSEKYLNS